MPSEGMAPMQPRFSGITDARIEYLVRSTEDPLAQDAPNVIFNLTRSPKRISSVYVYDKTGTALFERQCDTPEYYLRRVESQLLNWYSGDIVELSGFLPIVDLGAGTAGRTGRVLAEYATHGGRCAN